MLSHIFVSLILPKHAKTREPKDEHCVLQCPTIYMTLYPKTTLRLTHTYSTAIHNMGAHLGSQK